MAKTQTEPTNELGYVMCGWNGCNTYFQTLVGRVDPETGNPVLNPETREQVLVRDEEADGRDIWAHCESKHPEMFGT